MKTNKILALMAVVLLCSCGGGKKYNPEAGNGDEMSDSARAAAIAQKKADYNKSDDYVAYQGKIKLTVMTPNDDAIPSGVKSKIESKLIQLVTANGIGGLGGDPRYVLAPVTNVKKKGVTSTAPVRHFVEYDITFYVADLVTGTVFASQEISVKGAGNSDDEAAISAFDDIKANDSKLQKMLQTAEEKILAYYTEHGNEFIQQAQMLIAKQDYGPAMAVLQSIPTETGEVYNTAVSLMNEIAPKYIEREEALSKQLKEEQEKDKADAQAQERYMAEMQARIAEASNKCLLDKYKKDAAYDRLPWIRKVFYLGDNDPFDGYTPE